MGFARFVTLAAVGASLLATPTAAQIRRPMPVVQRIEPTSGPPGTTVSVIGRHFDSHQTVFLGSTPLEVQSRLPNRWTVTVPDGATSGNIEVRTGRGNVRGPRFRVTTARPAPVVSGFSPNGGSAGTEILIRGEHFSPRASENLVYLGETPVVVRTANPTELRVLVPEGASSGPWRVRVIGAGESASEDTFAVGSGTAVSAFEPVFGPPRTRVTIRGIGFHRSRARVRVYLGEARARVIRASETELTVEVPRRNAATGRWLVDVRGGGRAYSEAQFDVRYAPVISGIEPTFGAPGTRLTVAGEHFGTDVRAVTATLGGSELRVRDIADGRLVLEILPGTESGRVSLTIHEMGPTEGRQEIRVTPPCVVAGFTPRNGGVGTEVTIIGRGFSTTTAHNTVTISGQRAEIVSVSETEMVVRIPAARSGPIVVAVENAGESRTAHPFVVTAVPAISGVSPMRGPPGTEIVIAGRNFGNRLGLIEVRLGQRRMPIRRASATELRVVIPPNAASGRIRVTVRLQGSVEHPHELTVTSP